MKKIILSFLILAFFLFPSPVKSELKTNKFGIHILEPSQLSQASELVNSSGGDWGFITIVIRDDDLNTLKWQSFFDDCRELHLVPLMRIATRMTDKFWLKPQENEAEKWANFLGSLNWPTQDQWVIIFNEPNQAKEWGGEINPQEYARILNKFIEKFKAQSNNFKILNSGFDLAAPNSSQTMEASKYWQQMETEVPGIFQKLDGWASHSYPNHGFIGTPYQQGRTSIVGYKWELWILENRFKAKNDYPVFITETGWPYKINSQERFYSQIKTAEFIKIAYQNFWLPDKKVIAVTPFLLYYPQYPFENFSWINKGNKESEQFLTVKSMPKANWWPEQIFKLRLEKIPLPPFLPTKTEYQGKIIIRNIGQSIWGEKGDIEFKSHSSNANLFVSPLKLSSDKKIKPNDSTEINFSLKSSTLSGEAIFGWEQFPEFSLRIIPSSVIIKAEYSLWQKIRLFLEQIHLF